MIISEFSAKNWSLGGVPLSVAGEPFVSGVDEFLDYVAAATVFELEHDRYSGAPVFPAHWPGYVYTLHRRNGHLVDDFLFRRAGSVLHVLNAPSPAATACLPIGEHIAKELLATSDEN